MNSRTREVSLYLHFPFCVRKCLYCDFLSAPADEDARDRYVDLLCAEIRTRAGEMLYCEDGSSSKPGGDGGHCESCDGEPGGDGGHRESCDGEPVGDGGHRESGGAGSRECGIGGFGESGGPGSVLTSVYFGGGTPSLMTTDQLGRIMESIRSRCDVDRECEITIEVNPGTADHEKLRAYRALGVNRLSIGTQSFVPEELRLLGRIHTAGETREVYRAAREAGFENISLDLMSALPGQTVESWLFNLEQAVRLSPEHLSCYSLIIEEGTPLERMFARKELPPLPSEEDDREMYHITRDFLSKYGFHRYEISNYARAGFESRHNLGYWTGRPYLGLGLGASSDLGGKRFHNPESMEAYEEAVRTNCVGLREDVFRSSERDCVELREDEQALSDTDRMSEFMFLGLRLTKGVSEEEFAARFGKTMQEVYGETIRRQIGQGLLERSDGRVCLTEYGLDVANYVMADYLL